MKEQFVTYKIALKLKELGFDEECFAYYYVSRVISLNRYFDSDLDWNNIDLQIVKNSKFIAPEFYAAAPLWQQVIDWFREKHQIHLEFVYSQDHNKYSWSGWDEYHWRELSKRPRVNGRFPYPYKSRFKEHYWNIKTYEEAREQAILKCIELCQKEK